MLSSVLQLQYQQQLLKLTKLNAVDNYPIQWISLNQILSNLVRYETLGQELDPVTQNGFKQLQDYIKQLLNDLSKQYAYISSISIVDALQCNMFLLQEYHKLPLQIQTSLIKLFLIVFHEMDHNILLSFKPFFNQLSRIFEQYVEEFKSVSIRLVEAFNIQYMKFVILLINIRPQNNEVYYQLGDIINSMIRPYMRILLLRICSKSQENTQEFLNVPLNHKIITELAIHFKNYAMYEYFIILMTRNSCAKYIAKLVKLNYEESIQLIEQFNQAITQNSYLDQLNQKQFNTILINCLFICDSCFVKDYLDENHHINSLLEQYINNNDGYVSEMSYRVKYMIDGLGYMDLQSKQYYSSIFNL